jgi:type I restriction enzyme, S subunit
MDGDGRIIAAPPVEYGELGSTKYAFGPDHVLYGKLRPYLRKTARPDFTGVCSTEIVPLRPGPRLDRGYLYHYLRRPETVELAVARCAGANLPRISPREILAFELPLPPLPEQRRISGILDKADAIRRKRKDAIALADQLLHSAFLEMFGDPVTNPEGWKRSTFGDQMELLEYGPRFYNEKYSADGVRIVRITDLDSNGHLDFSSMPRLAVSEPERSRYALRPGDVIFARSGATVGKTALSMAGDPESIPGAYFIRLRFKAAITPLYARYVLACANVQRIIVARSRQSAQQNFSGPGIRDLPLPVPPRPLQERFENVARAQRILIEHCKHGKAASDALFDSLVRQAFAGYISRGRVLV